MEITSYEIKTSKTNHKVPVVNDIHLHSMYNPINEAESLINKYDDQIQEKSSVLVLGLAFGYHVQELVARLKKYHGDSYQVYIIEPNQRIVDDCVVTTPIDDPHVTILCYNNPFEIYYNNNLIDFLINKPAVIAHTATFNLNHEYFKQFLTYKAPNALVELSKHIQDYNLRDYLKPFDAQSSFEDICKTIKQKNSLERQDFLLLTLNEIFNSGV